MTKNRPKHLDLRTISLPIMGVASILHRISAVIIWCSMLFILPVLYMSLASSEGFYEIKNVLSQNFIAQFLLWGFLTSLGYYITGGIKHIIQEFGYFETLEGGRNISRAAISLGLLLSIILGYWLWG